MYHFPILKEGEIIDCMKEIKVDINIDDLKKPHEDRCRWIYASTLENLMKMDLNQQSLISFDKMDLFEYPNLHTQSVGQVLLVKNLIKFMQRIGVKDFSMSDVISPDCQRTKRNLSAIVNFAKFREEKMQIFDNLQKERKEVIKELEKAISDNKLLGSQFGKLGIKMEKEKPEIEALQQELQNLEKKIKENLQQYQEVRDNVHKIKPEIKVIKLNMQQNKANFNNLLEEMHNLESQIVQNPEQYKAKLKEMEDECTKKQSEIKTQSELFDKMVKKRDYTKKLNEVIKNNLINNLLLAIKDMKKQREDLLKKIENYKTSMKEKNKAIIQLDTETSRININIKKQKKEYEDVRKLYSEKKKQCAEKKRKVDEKKSKQEDRDSIMKENIVKITQEITEIRKKMDDMKENDEENINRLIKAWNEAKENIDHYHRTIKAKLQIV